MNEQRGGWLPPLSERQYRLIDRVSKLLGVVLVATGLHVGGSTPTGLAVAALGVVAGLLTVPINNE